jgi:B-cell receptor-associated protein 31
MSLQWTLVATFLYCEIAIVFLLIMPWISVQRWRKIFKSRILGSLEAQSEIYFTMALGLLVLLLLDAIREMYFYAHTKIDGDHHHRDLDQDMQLSMKTFRAQRNFYISGFSLILWVVIRRLVKIITSAALAELNLEAFKRQAESAIKEAERLRSEGGGGVSTKKAEEMAEELSIIRDRLRELEKENGKLIRENEAMKSQSEGVSREYDRLLGEYENLEKSGKEGDKKDD